MIQNPLPGHSGHGPTDPSEVVAGSAGEKPHSFRRSMVGRVVSAKMAKTVVVEVVTHRRDPLYGKYVRSRARYKAHDEKNVFKVGDQVEIQEHRPISRDKRFLVTRLVKKYVEE
jgi:small subunit ribosomal protein S17